MRIGLAADLHIKLSGPRSSECTRCMEWLRDDLIAQRPDLIVVAGDFYHQRATPTEERYAQEWLRSVVAGCGCDVLLVAGNQTHDDRDQLDVLAATHTDGGRVISVCRPAVVYDGKVRVSAVPWPDMGLLAAAMGPGASIADRREAARVALRDVLRGLRPTDPSRPHLLAAHLGVVGASVLSGQPVATMDEIAVTVGDLMEAGPGVVALGHIHAAQSLVAPVSVFYCGSLFRTSFGEAEGRKGYSVVEWTGKEWTVEDRDGPARRMPLLECSWNAGRLEGRSWIASDVRGAEVRLSVSFPADEREAARAAADAVKREMEEAGAFSVTIDPQPIVIQRTRCAEIASARTVAEKVGQWAKAIGVEVPENIDDKLAELEAEVQP